MSNEATSERQGGLLPFFILTFFITWGIAAFFFLFPAPFKAVFGELTASSPAFVLAVAAPTISATILTYLRSRWAGLRALYSRIVQWRFGIQWYALIVVVLPLVGFLISRMLVTHSQYDVSTAGMVLLLVLKELILGPLGEELGWRGFALPRLLQRFSPFVASLILGAIWGIWHIPAFFVSTLPQGGLALPTFLVAALCMSILVTWLYLHTGRSVLVAVLFHLMINVALDAFGAPMSAFTIFYAACAFLVVVLDRKLGWFGTRTAAGTVAVDAMNS